MFNLWPPMSPAAVWPDLGTRLFQFRQISRSLPKSATHKLFQCFLDSVPLHSKIPPLGPSMHPEAHILASRALTLSPPKRLLWPGFREKRIPKFQVPDLERHHPPPSLPPHLHLNLSPALRPAGWHILSEEGQGLFLPRLWQQGQSIYGGAGGADFATLDWFVGFKS